ncbi:MAG: FMN-binding protein [Burkholderiales bacterium]
MVRKRQQRQSLPARRRLQLLTLPLAARAGWRAFTIAASTSTAAYAAEYLSVEAAQRAAFPEATAFVAVPRALDAAARRKLADVANPPGARDPLVWRATGSGGPLGLFMVDAVIGKQEYITYSVAFDNAGRILRLDVLQYRETHGYEIRNDRWRAQFVGKSAADPVALNSDIANISGATLSCRHVTDGVRRLLALRALVA